MDKINIKITPKMKHHALSILSTLTLFLGITLIFYVSFLLWWPVKTIEVKDSPMPIVGSTKLQSGDMLVYHYDYCKYYEIPQSIEKAFVDGIIYKTDSTYATQLEKGCHEKNVSVPIPETLPTGDYKLRITTVIRINKLRTETTVYETKMFHVTNTTK